MDSIDCDKHARYFRMCLAALPARAQSEDANHMGLVYFCLQGLSLIKRMDVVAKDRDRYIAYIYQHLQETDTYQWFSASGTFVGSGNYDMPNLSSTYFALCCLLALGEDYSKHVKPEKIMAFVCQLQMKEDKGIHYKTDSFAGLFQTVLDPRTGTGFGDTDLRYCYLALSVRKLVQWTLDARSHSMDVDMELLQKFVLRKVSYNGGLSSIDGTEPHAGLTFCGLATLSLLGFDFENEGSLWVPKTLNWLVKRQTDYPESLYKADSQGNYDYDYYVEEDCGGFNGRENKFSDTCYAWWVTGALELISPDIGLSLIDSKEAASYLLEGTQNQLLGGFGKDQELQPDPFHSFLALASLALWLQRNVIQLLGSPLDGIDPQLVISKASADFFTNHIKWSCT